MPGAVTIGLKAPKFAILVARASGLSQYGVTKAISSALTFTAKDYSIFKTARIDQDIDRPKPFTKRAFTYDGANASDDPIQSRSYVRPRQADYLEHVEFGGDVTGSPDQKGGPVWIKDGQGDQKDYTDKFGGGWGQAGFSRKWLNKSRLKQMNSSKRRADGSYAVGTKLYRIFTLSKDGQEIRGIWEMTKIAKKNYDVRDGRRRKYEEGNFGRNLKKSWKTYLIVEFLSVAHYDDPRLHFESDGMKFGREKLPKLAQRLLETATAKLAG